MAVFDVEYTCNHRSKTALEIVKKHGGVLVPSDEGTRAGVGESLYMACDLHGHLKTGAEASWKWYVCF